MRVVATEYVTLDGVFEDPQLWSGPFFGEEAAEFKWNELQASDALLLGRKTYEGFAAAWPTRADDFFADRMNTMDKYVVSSTLAQADWSGSKLIKDDVAEHIRKLKQEPGQDLLLSGSAQLFNALMAENVIDLYRFMLYPVAVGNGRRLFADGSNNTPLRLTSTHAFSTGVVILEYEPAT